VRTDAGRSIAWSGSETHHAQPQPAVVYTLARETHLSDLEPNESTRVQHGFEYSDGFGRVVH